MSLDHDQLRRLLGAPAAGVLVVYDGECIFCNSYVSLMRLRSAVGEVKLLDARARGVAGRIREALGLDLDRGMLVLYGGRSYFGADAMRILSELSSRSGTWNSVMAEVFRHRWLARGLYPVLKAGRRATLWLRGRSPIG